VGRISVSSLVLTSFHVFLPLFAALADPYFNVHTFFRCHAAVSLKDSLRGCPLAHSRFCYAVLPLLSCLRWWEVVLIYTNSPECKLTLSYEAGTYGP
jgi:hypothetical protein